MAEKSGERTKREARRQRSDRQIGGYQEINAINAREEWKQDGRPVTSDPEEDEAEEARV
jgi:hypothetical protein